MPLRKIRSYLRSKLLNKTIHHTRLLEKQVLLLAQMQSKNNRNLAQIDHLGDVEFSAYSQWGEDGIIDWLISKLPEIPKTFVEFGVENYRESNTRLLLQLRNWRGLIMDSSRTCIEDIRSQEIYWRYSLNAIQAFIKKENINKLLNDGGMNGEIGLLSIDIDGNDYWVWEQLEVVNPAIVVIEYNAVFGDLHALTIPYSNDFYRTKAHHSNLYFGASLPALTMLADRKGYTFIGTTTSGVNAFFIRNDLAPRIISMINSVRSYPSKNREARNKEGRLLFIDGIDRIAMVSHLPLIDVKSNSIKTLGDFDEIYSHSWRRELNE